MLAFVYQGAVEAGSPAIVHAADLISAAITIQLDLRDEIEALKAQLRAVSPGGLQ